MKILYHCYGSSHTSVTSAAIHIGLLPRDRIPTVKEILAIPHFDQTTNKEIGMPFFMGVDQWGNDVYIIARKRNYRLLTNMVRSLMEIRGAHPQDLLLVNALSAASLVTTFGGFLSRGLGLIWLGRPLAALGIKRSYLRFLRLVEDTEARIRENTPVLLEESLPTGRSK